MIELILTVGTVLVICWLCDLVEREDKNDTDIWKP